MITFVPYAVHHEPSKCPKCKGPENIKNVCRGCGYEYEYEESEDSVWLEIVLMVVAAIAIILLGAWAMKIISDWLSQYGVKQSLFELIKNDLEFIRTLRIF